LSSICLSDIVDLIEREATVEELTECIKEDIAMMTCGKYQGLIAQEKTRVFEAALEEARADGLHDACAQGAKEATQKGRSYGAMLLTRAEEEARVEVDQLFKNQLKSARSKLKRKVKAEVEAEHAAVIAERRSALETQLAQMDFNARKDYIRSQAIQMGLLDDSATPVPSPPKRTKVGNAPKTAPLAASKATSKAASSASQWSAPAEPTPPPLEPSSRPAAEEDVSTPRNSPSRMDWVDSSHEDPLPMIDFDADMHSSKASIYCPSNAMTDDKVTPRVVASFRDPDSGPIKLPTSPPTPRSTPVVPITPAAPKSEVAQLFDMIVAKMALMEREIARIAGIVDGKVAPTHKGPRPMSGATPRPPPSSGPTPRHSSTKTASSSNKAPSWTAMAWVDDEDNNFPSLTPLPAGTPQTHRNSVGPRAPAQGSSGSGQSRPHIGLMFASVVTNAAMDQREKAAGHARLAREVQKCNPSGKFKPGCSG
jgi:hypothetical protein